MSHDGHDGHGATGAQGPPEYLKDRGGFAMPGGALIFVAITILLSIMQGAFVVGSSGWGHIWPAQQSGALQLPPAHLTP